MSHRPLVAFACCWLAGVSVPSLWHGYAQVFALGGMGLILAGGWRMGKLTGRLALVGAMAMLAAWGERTMLGHARQSDLSVLWEHDGVPESAHVTGWISSQPDVDGDSVTFRMAANRVGEGSFIKNAAIHETVLVRVKLKERREQAVAARWKRGDAVRVEGAPERPGDAGNFGAFDYRSYLERQAILWQWSVRGADAIRLTGQQVSLHLRPLRVVDELRSAIGGLMNRLYPDGDAGYMKGLVAGITEEIDPAQYDAFSRLGLTHVLAISGLHVGVVVFVLLQLGALFRFTRERSIDIAIAAMPLYMLVTGASPSAVRACLMAIIALALARRHRLKDGLHLLAAAALLMAVWDPAVVENVSFQLSFAVTAGLLLFTPVVSRLLMFVRFKMLRNALAVGITAQVVSFPLTVYYFHGFHLLSLPANLVLVPFISFVVMPLGMASVALGAVWTPLGMLPAKLASYGNVLTFDLAGLLDGADKLRIIWPQPSKLWVACAYVLLGVTLWMVKRRLESRQHFDETWGEEATAPLEPVSTTVRGIGRAWTMGIVLSLLWGGWWLWGYRPSVLDSNAYVEFLDVGQGDGILIRTGKGKYVLIDAGGTVNFRKPGEEWRERRDPYEIGRKLIVPLLRQRGVRELDALVLTHLDADHIGGAEAVLRQIPVRAIICNGTWKENAAVAVLYEAALRRGIPVYSAVGGQHWNIDVSASMDVLYPDAIPAAGKGGRLGEPALLPVLSKQNERSIVLVMILYGRRFLLTGDVETPGEADIINDAAVQHTPVDVMKAAHHGSRTSTSPAWLDEWRPLEAVISVGRRNLYGHPYPAIVARIQDFGSLLFRTDRDGEIQYRIQPDGTLQRRRKRGPGETPLP